MSRDTHAVWDVVIAGGGVAGLSAATLLAERGLRVVCIEPEGFPRDRVGESVDWSAPALLADLGLSRDALIAAAAGTYKREVLAIAADGDRFEGRPRRWLARWPLGFELTTLHLDRRRFDRLLYERARSCGAAFVWDRIDEVVLDRDRVVGCETRSGRRFIPDWFIDATGRRRLLSRAANIDRAAWGIPRVSLWSQCDASMALEGTVLHIDDESDDLTWVWEIPIAETRVSVGTVMPLTRFQALRRSGAAIADILVDDLVRCPRFRTGPPPRMATVRTRSYRPFVSRRVAGTNWVLAGEAAAFVDPLASIGITMAMRHGLEAAGLILEDRRNPAATSRQLAGYDSRVRAVATLYNLGMENLLYRPEVRRAFGFRRAARAYVALGYSTNSLYSRLDPTTPARMAALRCLLGFFRLWTRTWRTLARLVSSPRGGHRTMAHGRADDVPGS